MRSVLALMRVSWLTHTSYRLNVIMSVLGLGALFIPIYFVADALQPVVADSIADEGEVYFGFLITGMVILQFLSVGMNAVPNAVSGGINSGVLEALFATPTRLERLLAGMIGYETLWAAFKGLLLLVAFVAVGGEVALSGIPLALGILVLLFVAHLPLGLLAAAMILVFRTSGPLIPGLMAAFSLLGGVYYSTTVIPEVVRPLAEAIPLTYGLRAFRRSFLSGEPLAAVVGDVLILAGMAAALMLVGVLAFRWALNYARRAGSLAQY
ncbi:MAG: ABC transporter permease [Gemmatimonadales bacterium]|nr:MAG: ABC transporter permease [Gemmatimonadales bacterium]